MCLAPLRCFSEVLREVHGFVPPRLDPSELDGLEGEEAAELEQARQRLRSCVRSFTGSGDAPPAAQTKVFRLATARFLKAVDHVLKQVTGHGFESFATAQTKVECVQEGRRAKLAEWKAGAARTLTLAADQQSCGPSGVSFLQAGDLRLCADLVMDPPPQVLELREARADRRGWVGGGAPDQSALQCEGGPLALGWLLPAAERS